MKIGKISAKIHEIGKIKAIFGLGMTPIYGLKNGQIKSLAMDTIFLKTRSEVKVKVTGKWNMTLRYPKMYPHTKFGIPNSKNIRDMLRTQ